MIKPSLLDKGQLINRLTAQVGSKAKAIAILQKRGDEVFLRPDWVVNHGDLVGGF